MTWVRRFAVATAVATYLLVVIGGIVRVTGSTPVCPAWPVCEQSLVFPGDPSTWMGFSYRLLAVAVLALSAATALTAWRAGTRDRLIKVPAAGLIVALAAHGLFAALGVDSAVTGVASVADLGTAMALLGMALVLATAGYYPARGQALVLGARAQRQVRRYRRLVLGTALAVALATYAMLLTDGTVAARSVRDACAGAAAGCVGGNPLANLGAIHWAVSAVGLLLGATFWQTYRERRSQQRLVQVALLSGLLFVAQIAIGAVYLFTGFPAGLAGLHLALATMTWASVVVFTVLVFRAPTPATAPSSVGIPAPRRAAWLPSDLSGIIRDYVALTKPRVISLLLVTTLGAMMVAAEGVPSWGLVFWTLLGGYLAAGGANAINMYYDRDIDAIMSRTRKRPVPSHRLTPERALVFGIALGVLSFVVYAVFVNLLSGLFAIAGLLFYVFIYTGWLKRSSPQNIVIGGAAGAFPPLVGWAAVTNSISLLAVWLFIIIFYWTPPHFWALALMRRTDYANAGVPMLPVVYGEPEARRQILLYSALMVAVTLILVPFGMMGLIYLVLAGLLGAIWMVYALRIWREGSPEATWGLYKYSLLYLALLFVAMVVDRMVL